MALALGGGIVTVIGLMLFILGRQKASGDRAFRARAQRVTGRIVELTGEDGDMPTVAFEDAHGGRHRIAGRTNAGRGAVIGGPLVVFYEPDKPEHARLAQDMVATAGVMMVVGFVLLAGGGVAVAVGLAFT